MKSAKPARVWIVVLVAWVLSFQALASVGGVPCVHSGTRISEQAAAESMMDASMPGMDMQHMHHMKHGSALKTPGDLASKLTGCGCGCSCAGHCSMPCPAVATSFALTIPKASSSPISRSSPLSLASAYGLDLFRPPSIS